jgi:pSer/pThr/pTyr-binding forkhead associated (FHA) protein
MSPEIVLLLLRLAGAAVLLAFFGLIGWYIYQDVRLASAALAAQSQPLGRLIVVENRAGSPAVGTRYPLLPVTSIGRSSSNVIVLDDGYTSGQHSLIMRRGELWWLEDLGSRNGTLLNDAPLVETAVLSTGDIITIGNIKLKLELE